jgi:two-component system response regulator CpxR
MRTERVTSLLVVSDDGELCAVLGDILRQQEFAVEFALDGLVGLNRALDEPFDLLILGSTLPGLDGFEVLRQLRKESTVPVLMLAAGSDKEDRIRALELGADDYLAKPFEPRELVARLHAILRRSAPTLLPAAEPLRIGDLTLFPGARDAYLGNRRLRLTVMECKILEQLMRAAGRPVSRDQLCLLLYGRPASPSERFIDTHIGRIRRKMGEQSGMILSVRGTGYQLRVPLEQETVSETGSGSG